MTNKQAARWYEFCVGQITTDINGDICIRTLDGNLHSITDKNERDYVKSDSGFLCTFWKKKSNGQVKNVGVTGLQEKLTETNVAWLWEINFAA
jgi:hypothetical protein